MDFLSNRRVKSNLLLLFIFLLIGFSVQAAEKSDRLNKKAEKAALEFLKQASDGFVYRYKLDSLSLNPDQKEITVYVNSTFSYIPFRPATVKQYHNELKEILGRKFKKYNVCIESMGMEIGELIPNYYRDETFPLAKDRLSVKSDNTKPLVRKIGNETYQHGLESKHIALWHSHGWYYENTLDRWEWQRARVYTTVEDMWTMEFVVPYIAPMLENAGANILLPRERDVQTHEVIVDADWCSILSDYKESGNWEIGSQAGFRNKYPFYIEGENPFKMGNSKQAKAFLAETARVEYIPYIPEKGEYAVYLSYSVNDDNVCDAHYTVYHAGGKTDFLVNQSMGGDTWIYLGTFLFDKGKNPESGKVLLTNESKEEGHWVSADAVRFGGGMGNIARGNVDELNELVKERNKLGFAMDSAKWQRYTSNRPRYHEAARYYLQYAGMSDSIVYSINKNYKVDYSNRGKDAAKFQKRESGKTDYKDDYMSRGEWVDYLIGAPNGPSKNINVKGLGIPVDIALGFHTDAGFTPNDSIIGTLAIYNTTRDNRDKFVNGQSKWASRDLVDIVQTQVVEDIRKLFEPKWTRRGMWNKQYSEAYRPKVPTMLSEMLSHHNFADMYQGMDPKFKFHISRAYYKGVLKFLTSQEGKEYVVQPLPVDHFRIDENENGVRLSWKAVADPLEKSAVAKKYKVYTRLNDGGFDNGILVEKEELLLDNLSSEIIYSFKITALNDGGESFPSEILSYCKLANGEKPVLIVNGFDRIASPNGFDDGKYAGFNSAVDEGVAYKRNIAYVGDQYDFDRKSPWLDDDASGHGSCYADKEEKIIPGNSFDYPYVHGEAIKAAGYGFVSMSDESFERGNWKATDYKALDLIFGEEKTTRRIYGKENKDFTIYTPDMVRAIRKYILSKDAKLILSGAYLGTDVIECGDTLMKEFIEKELHFLFRTNYASKSGAIYHPNEVRKDFSGEYQFETGYNRNIYKVEAPDAIEPVGKNAKVFLRFTYNSKSAGVVYDGDYHSIILGFPFETLRTKKDRNEMMSKIMRFFNK
ncbi:fibronectin type III domain-containing protein [Marinifilum sp.]|uniref:golvesin C-terminal-like domain-containing protein n=1 Tax=Marinifilum sp. TaxID=2033137 RepID=UPI003BABE05C